MIIRSKFTYEYVQKLLKINGYNLLTQKEEYDMLDKCINIEYEDKYGYKYKMLFSSDMLKHKPQVVHKKNIYSIYNIRLYIELNNIPIQLLSNEYVNSTSKLKVKCKCGEIYHTTWSSMKQGKGCQCKKCTYIKIANTRTTTFDEICNIFDMNGLLVIGGDYKTTTSMLEAIDDEGYKYITSANYLTQSSKPYKFTYSNPYTIDNIKNYLKRNGCDIEIISDTFVSVDTHMLFRCLKCGEYFETTMSSITSNNMKICGKCSCKQQGENNRLDINEVRKRFYEVGLYIINSDTFIYEGVNQKISLIDNNGYKYYTSLSCIKKKKHTDNCDTSRNGKFEQGNPYVIDNIKNYIFINNLPCKLISDIYMDCKAKLEFKCLECGNIFKTNINIFISSGKHRCDVCTHAQSNISWLTEQYIKSMEIKYAKEYKIDDCRNIMPLPFDFAILNKENSLVGLIEVDGEQHYRATNMGNTKMSEADIQENFNKRKRYDKIKNDYCINNKIKLIRVPYWLFKSEKYKKYLDIELKKILN